MSVQLASENLLSPGALRGRILSQHTKTTKDSAFKHLESKSKHSFEFKILKKSRNQYLEQTNAFLCISTKGLPQEREASPQGWRGRGLIPITQLREVPSLPAQEPPWLDGASLVPLHRLQPQDGSHPWWVLPLLSE